ncbi:A disintegrin and metalloproteinase with thrombospondin motifs 6-like isoform X1 [Trichogramma pretiosum]|uniref:A disintegrin and metalloproteinase with thrombospondin motifs 6-like isoform X1 n=2 Tax=Trichogramma pretiosum TaxID=7493 RepID=UPI0006C94BD0|nr:A disintegrin and metalloproteinase with thrombospondin motifs 6-like isoform X1 [Trichogramma pretiosum]
MRIEIGKMPGSLCILLCIALAAVDSSSAIHHHMTPEEVLSVFHTDHNSIPDYQVIPLLHKRGENETTATLHMKVFNETFSLALNKNDRLWKGDHVPVWTLDDDGKEIINETDLRFERVADGEHIGHAYQDEDNMAAVLLYRDSKGRLLVDGSIGEDLVIRPIPARVLKDVVSKMDHLQSTRLVPKVSRDRRSVDYELTDHHVVYKRSASHEDDMYSDFAYMEPDRLNKRYRRKRSIDDLDARVKRSLELHTREKREAPYVIYPEILCIVDYDGYRMHGGDNPNVKRYFVSFWNGVDLRYKLLKGPKIRISIAGIIISRAKNATPYLERNRVGRDAIDSAAALTDMGKYLYRERRLPVYDIAVAVTKLDMCRRQYANEVCNRGTAGFAYVGGACVVNKRLEKVNSVAIIEDTGGFSGIIVAAHEVGHLLGAVHDGSPPPSYLGGPGAQKCRWEDGYIMSDLRHTEKGFRWSSCSVQSFHHFLNGDTATCLYNAPHEDEALPRVLPGKMLSLDAQCRKDRGTKACFYDARVCAQLFCFDQTSGYCVAYRPAAEGSPCGDGQYCLNGKCVAEHENIIPDYTQNIPTYVRQDSFARSTYNNTSTEYRYQWSGTTRSINELRNQYTTLAPLSSTTVTPPPSVITTTAKQFFTPSPAPFYKQYVYSTESNLITDDQNKQKYGNYQNNIDYYKKSYHSTISSGKGFSFSYNLPNSHVMPLNYQSTVRPPSSLAWTSPKFTQPSYTLGTEVGECQDTRTDCADLIARLRSWLCHLQTVKSRCCASLKTVC